MDDKNSTPEHEATPAAAPSVTASSADAGRPETGFATSTPAAAPKRNRARAWLIAGGATLVAALLAGGGIAVGAAIADEADDIDGATSAAVDRDDNSRGGHDSDDDRTGGDLARPGTESADDLVAMIDAASSVGEGEPVSIDLERDGGAEVKFETEGGAETEVRVDGDGEASVVSTESADSDDAGPVHVLEADVIAAIVEAALAETDGRVVEIEADDDSSSPWDVTVLTDEGAFVELDLDAEFAVVSTGGGSD